MKKENTVALFVWIAFKIYMYLLQGTRFHSKLRCQLHKFGVKISELLLQDSYKKLRTLSQQANPSRGYLQEFRQ